MFLETFFISSISTSSATFSKFDALNVILFQIKVFGRDIKETTLAKYFIKVTVCPSFTRLRVIRRIYLYISLNIKIENMLQRLSCIS